MAFEIMVPYSTLVPVILVVALKNNLVKYAFGKIRIREINFQYPTGIV
jgi:hypothetical protein